MTITTLYKECTRKYCKDGREFIIHYEFVPFVDSDTYLIKAQLEELQTGDKCTTAVSCIELVCPYPELSQKLFDFINDAQEPIFPVHLPEIIHDQISCTLLSELQFTLNTISV